MTTGTVFEIREFSLFDGPGVRTTVFLKGCPLKCAWCHNPEGIRPEPELLVTENLCRHCGRCKAVCPLRAGSNGEQGGKKGGERSECLACGKCVSACPGRIRRICGERMTEDALIARLLTYRDFFEAEGGGVTFSGGEPLFQADFTAACALRLRKVGIRTAVETCGFASESDYLRVISSIDLVIQDLKHPDPILHRRWTGVDNAPILRNLRLLAASKVPAIIRIPLIPGVNDSLATLRDFAAIASEIPSLIRVELLPFHAAGRAKQRLLKSDPTVLGGKDASFWSADEISKNTDLDPDEIMAPFRERGLSIQID